MSTVLRIVIPSLLLTFLPFPSPALAADSSVPDSVIAAALSSQIRRQHEVVSVRRELYDLKESYLHAVLTPPLLNALGLDLPASSLYARATIPTRLSRIAELQRYYDMLEFSASFDLGALATSVAPSGTDVSLLAATWLDLPPSRFTLIATALSLLGTPYEFGASSTYQVDCSGFTSLVYRSIGIDLRLKASYQFEDLVSIEAGHVEPGDLVFYAGGPTAAGPLNIGHVALYLGTGLVIHASAAHGSVTISAVQYHRPPVAYARVLMPTTPLPPATPPTFLDLYDSSIGTK